MERSSPRNHWERVALAGLYEDLAEEHRRLTIQAFASSRVRPHVDDGTEPCRRRSASWLRSEVAGFSRWQRLLSELDSQPGADLAMIAVAIRALALLDATPATGRLTAGMATVLCMKWGRRYGPDYVNTLASMLRRHLTVRHRLVCLTDDRIRHPRRGRVPAAAGAGARARVGALALAQAQLLRAGARRSRRTGAVPRPRRGDRRPDRRAVRASRRLLHHRELDPARPRHRQLLGLPLSRRRPSGGLRAVSRRPRRRRSASIPTRRPSCRATCRT